MKVKRQAMKSQDVVVLCSLLTLQRTDWVVAEVAYRACLSVSETHAAIRRLETSGLFTPVTRSPVMDAVKEFFLHGIKYIFPAETGKRAARGIPTAHSAPPLCDQIVSDEENTYVWPCPFGKKKGTSVTPLYKTVPEAAHKDVDMYYLLALIDAISLGRVRERELAEGILTKKLERLEACRHDSQ